MKASWELTSQTPMDDAPHDIAIVPGPAGEARGLPSAPCCSPSVCLLPWHEAGSDGGLVTRALRISSPCELPPPSLLRGRTACFVSGGCRGRTGGTVMASGRNEEGISCFNQTPALLPTLSLSPPRHVCQRSPADLSIFPLRKGEIEERRLHLLLGETRERGQGGLFRFKWGEPRPEDSRLTQGEAAEAAKNHPLRGTAAFEGPRDEDGEPEIIIEDKATPLLAPQLTPLPPPPLFLRHKLPSIAGRCEGGHRRALHVRRTGR